MLATRPSPQNTGPKDYSTMLFLVAFTAGVFFVFSSSDSAWLHPELLGTAVYIWNNPETDTVLALLRKTFDWKAFDPNVDRVRPLNDLVEVLDAMSRPFISAVTGPLPAVSPSSILTALIAPLLLYGALRRVLKGVFLAALITVIFVSTVAFLSDVVVYIRPAKRIALL